MMSATWADVADALMAGVKSVNDGPRVFERVGLALEKIAASDLPPEVAAEAGRLLVEVDRLMKDLLRLANAVGQSDDGSMPPA